MCFSPEFQWLSAVGSLHALLSFARGGDKRALMGLEKSSLRIVANQDGAAILDPHSGQITTLNTTAAYIWQALERGSSAEAIASDLAQETGENLSVVKQGVTAFLTELEERQLWSTR
jgi:coenzyme PQQ synthesis protein D (PqqD)